MKRTRQLGRSRFAVMGGLMTLMGLAAVAPAQAPDRASPFTAVRWEGDDPLVRFEGEWYGFESLDGISKAELIAYTQKTYGNRWQKRFSEDLVEVLQGMGHAPQATVRLTLRLNGNLVTKTGRMTEENRRSVLRYNNGEEETTAARRPPNTREPSPPCQRAKRCSASNADATTCA